MQVDGKGSVERRIAGAFKAAADVTGTSFDYLLKTSQRESDHRADLGASGSSAKGLFQFVDQTWLEMIHREGATVGLERLAEKITPDGKGGWMVADPTDRAKIMALKTDPLVSAVMAGKFTQDNARRLGEALGRTPSDGELYAAHVLGPAGAIRLFKLASSEPNTGASVAFPRAAAANPGLFYDSGGRARTVADLLDRLTRGADTGADPTTARIAAIHGSLSASSSKTDSTSVALLLRAQAAALVGTEAIGTAAAAPTAADRALVASTLGEVGLPGASEAASAGRLDGWRAHVTRDAFAGLMRDDGTSRDAAGALAASRALPGFTGAQSAKAAIAVARAAASAPAGPGGIALIDPDAPMALAATTPSPSIAALDRVVPERPSRFAVAAATGAPEMPLPMVDAAAGERRPSRLLFEAWRAPSDDARAAGLVRVRTSTITPPGAAPVAAAGTDSAAAAAPPPSAPAAISATAPPAASPAPSEVPATASPGAARRARPTRTGPLDLVALARRGGGTP